MSGAPASYDLLVVGGGINGAGIARDAAGRGLRTLLCEQHDLASHTSSASTKLEFNIGDGLCDITPQYRSIQNQLKS